MKSVIFLACVMTILSCNKDDLVDPSLPDPCATIVDDIALYQSGESGVFTIMQASIKDDACLEVTLESNGCNGSTWLATLVQGDIVVGQDQTSVQMRILLTNDEECRGLPSRAFAFDVSGLINHDFISLQGYDQAIEL